MLWKVTRADSTILGFTNHDVDITYNDGTDTVDYKALTGYTPSATESGSDLGTDNLQVVAFLDSAAIDEDDLRAGLYDYCDVQIRLVNYSDLTMGDLKIRKGTLGQVKIQNGEFTAEIRGLTFWLTTVIGDTFGPTCRADLGDATCTIDLTPLRQTGSVLSLTDNQTFIPSSGLSPAQAGYFTDGILTWTSGNNDGFEMEVSEWDGTTVTLFESMANDIQAGDTFTIEPGCDKTPATCQNKFTNIVNFQGEPYIPGMDAILQYPDAVG
jgi:uncharacterized phage protein (TIGR02218 family)